jgi:hypothetical protein
LALLTVIAITASSVLLLGHWYHDDACTIEERQCGLGTFAFAQAFLALFSAGIAVAWVVVEVVLLAIRQGDTEPASPLRHDLRWGALGGLVLLAGPWIVWGALETVA